MKVRALVHGFAVACGVASIVAIPAEAAPAAPEVLTFSSGDAKLAGALYRAPGAGPRPAIVLLGGTGPVSKNSPGFRPLIVPFTSAGYDVFAYGKRGVGDSPGRFDPYQSVDSLADDGIAAVHALQHVADVDPRWRSHAAGIRMPRSSSSRTADTVFNSSRRCASATSAANATPSRATTSRFRATSSA